MSTLHHELHWPQVKEKYQWDNPPYCESSTGEKRIIHVISALMVSDFIDKIQTAALERINNPPEKAQYLFSFNINTTLRGVIGDLQKSFNDRSIRNIEKINTLLTTLNVQREEFSSCFEKAKKHANEIVPSLSRPIFQLDSSRENKQSIKDWGLDFMIDFLDKSYGKCGFGEKVSEELLFSEEDRSYWNGAFDLNAFDPKKISCLAYALCKVRDPDAADYIFRQKVDGSFEESLKNLGYREVKDPDVGDIILYYNDRPELRSENKICHVGVYKGNGIVESKFGINYPFVRRHEIFDSPINYGNKIDFYRKPGLLNF